MSVGSEIQCAVRAGLAVRIDTIGRELSHMSPSRLVCAVDAIRRDARAGRLETVAALAGGLERALSGSAGAAVALPFLEAMSDAVAHGDDRPAATSAWLASVGARLNG